MKTDKPTSFRMSERALKLLAELAENMGVSRAGVLEILIREKAATTLPVLNTEPITRNTP